MSDNTDCRNHDEWVMSKIQEITRVDKMIVPIFTKFLVHGDACNEKRHIDPNPRPEAKEYLLPCCLIKGIKVKAPYS